MSVVNNSQGIAEIENHENHYYDASLMFSTFAFISVILRGVLPFVHYFILGFHVVSQGADGHKKPNEEYRE